MLLLVLANILILEVEDQRGQKILQTVHGVDDKFGFDLKPYGYGQLKPEPSMLMKIINFIGEGASMIKN